MNKAGIDALKAALKAAQDNLDIQSRYLNGIEEKLARTSRDHAAATQLVEALTEAVRNAVGKNEP